MDAGMPDRPSYLFTVRLWPAEPRAGGEQTWRAEIKDLASGERRYCRDWQRLIDHLQELMSTYSDGHTL